MGGSCSQAVLPQDVLCPLQWPQHGPQRPQHSLLCPRSSSEDAGHPTACMGRASHRAPCVLVNRSAGEQRRGRCRLDPVAALSGRSPQGHHPPAPGRVMGPSVELSSLHHTPEGLGPNGPRRPLRTLGGVTGKAPSLKHRQSHW